MDGSKESSKSCGGTPCISPKVRQGTARAIYFLGTFSVSGQGLWTGMSQNAGRWPMTGLGRDVGSWRWALLQCTRQWHGFLGREQDAGISRGLGQQGVMVPSEPDTSLGRLGEREPPKEEIEPDIEEYECP